MSLSLHPRRPAAFPWSALLLGLALALPAGAQVRSGRFVEWNELLLTQFGDGLNHATGSSSIGEFNPPTAWFYGGPGVASDSAVAHAAGFCPVRSLMAFRHLTTGHYALLRLDGLRHANPEGYLDGSWWFQSTLMSGTAVAGPR